MAAPAGSTQIAETYTLLGTFLAQKHCLQGAEARNNRGPEAVPRITYLSGCGQEELREVVPNPKALQQIVVGIMFGNCLRKPRERERERETF